MQINMHLSYQNLRPVHNFIEAWCTCLFNSCCGISHFSGSSSFGLLVVTVIEGFRNIFLNTGNITVEMILVSFLVSFLCLMVGIIYFSKTERIFADVV